MADRSRRPRKADLSLLKEMMGADLPPAALRPKPSAARLPQASRGMSAAAMRAKIEATKADDGAIEARMGALLRFNGSQKQRASLQAHKQDWRKTHTELQRERWELEASRWEELPAAQRQPSHRIGSAGRASRAGRDGRAAGRGGRGRGRGDLSGGEVGAAGDAAVVDSEAGTAAETGSVLAEIREEEDRADAQRAAWSREMRAQLTSIRDLCGAARGGKGPVAPGRALDLLRELRAALEDQGGVLAAAAEAIEAELHEAPARLLTDPAERGSKGGARCAPMTSYRRIHVCVCVCVHTRELLTSSGSPSP